MSGDPLRTSQTITSAHAKAPIRTTGAEHSHAPIGRDSPISMFLRRLARLAANEPSLIDLQFHYVWRVTGVERDHNAIFSMRR